MSVTDDNKKKDVLNRLKTIKGHIAGIEKMIEEGKPCSDILVQLLAVKSSVHKAGIVVIESHAVDCLKSDDKNKCVSREEVENVIKTIVNFTK
jgi:DNA-binding FrmR family transcriptional regulator